MNNAWKAARCLALTLNEEQKKALLLLTDYVSESGVTKGQLAPFYSALFLSFDKPTAAEQGYALELAQQHNWDVFYP